MPFHCDGTMQNASLRCLPMILLGCLAAAGCASTPSPPEPMVSLISDLESHCAPSSGPAVRASEQGAASAEAEDAEPPLPLSSLSPRAWKMAKIIGIDRTLSHVPTLQTQAGRMEEGAALQLLTVRRQLSDRLLLALIEAGSIAAELDCERARAEELAVRLEETQNDIQHSRTVRAIVGEAGMQLAAGALLIAGLPATAGGAQIAGNVNALGHGLAALGGQQETTLMQERNLLRELWHGPEQPQFFPLSVWQFLKQPVEDQADKTRRDAILSLWQGRLGMPGSETVARREELFFGQGGIYGVDELRHRADMLALLKAFVNLMNQELNLLFRETLVLLNREGP
jgi:hypothetical protein